MIFPAWHDANRWGSTLCNCFRWQIPLRTHMLPGRTGCCVVQMLITCAEGCFQLAVFLRLCACITSVVSEASELARSSFGWWWFICRWEHAFKICILQSCGKYKILSSPWMRAAIRQSWTRVADRHCCISTYTRMTTWLIYTSSEPLDYEKVMTAKLRLLRMAYEASGKRVVESEEFADFVLDQVTDLNLDPYINGWDVTLQFQGYWLKPYALYCVLRFCLLKLVCSCIDAQQGTCMVWVIHHNGARWAGYHLHRWWFRSFSMVEVSDFVF